MSQASFPRLFVTDLDGTALGGGHQPYARFPDEFSSFLDRLAKRGCQWAINTTWGAHGQWQLVLSSSVQSRPSFFMAEMGTRLARWGESGPVFVQPYTGETEAEVRKANEEHLFPLMQGVCGQFRPRLMHFYGHWFDFTAEESDESKLLAYINLELQTNGHLHVDAKAGSPLVAYPALLGKGRSLREALRLAGIEAEQVAVAGDAPPDLTMMAHAKYLLAPANACPEVQEQVRANGGAVGESGYGAGVIEAFAVLAKKNGWDY